jgi:outer membrane protein assembly factor BamB
MKREALVSFVLVTLFLVSLFPISTLSRAADSHDGSRVSRAQSTVDPVDWWTMFHHDLSHTGFSASTGPDTGNILWTYTTGGAVESSPAVADGKVYVGSWDHNIYCLDAASGTLVWRYTTGDLVSSSPAVVNGKVYVGSYDGNIYCLDAASGTLVWRSSGFGIVASSPAVVNGEVFVGCLGREDGSIYGICCLNAASGALVWNYPAGGGVDWQSPAVADGKVYVGTEDYHFYCLDAASGTLVWSYFEVSHAGVFDSSPAVVNGKVYVESYSRIDCLDATTGGANWRYDLPLPGPVSVSSPAVVDGKVFVGSGDHNVYCLNALTGAKIWSYATGDGVGSSPAVAGGVVYVGSSDSNVYALDATTGALVWSYTTGSYVESSPAVAGGVVYVGSSDSNVYAFGPSGAPSLTSVVCSPNPVSVGSPVTCSATVSGSNPTGIVSWSTDSSTGCFSQLLCNLCLGSCSTTYTDTRPGTVSITASYSGDSNNAPSSRSTTLAVNAPSLPYKPLNLRAQYELPSGSQFSKAQLLWDAPSNPPEAPSGYKVYRGTSEDNVQFVASTTQTNYVDGFPSVDGIYCYRVSAVFSTGESVLSDPTFFASLEGTNGVENAVFLTGVASDRSFSIQQNFNIPRGTEGYYWVQNIVCVGGNYVGGIWMGGKLQIWNYTYNPTNKKYENVNPLGRPIVDEPFIIIALGNPMYEFVLRSTIEGTTLSVENPFLMQYNSGQPYTFEVPNGSFISDVVLSGGLHPIDPYDGSPQIAFVSCPFTQPIYPTVDFLEGMSGKVNSYIRYSTTSGNQWFLCTPDKNIVLKKGSAHTGESSVGLQWDSSGLFSYSATGSDQGVWFVPSYDSISSPPASTPAATCNVIELCAKCPVYLNLFDKNGNMCGYNSTFGVIESQIASAICLSNDTICIINGSDIYSLFVIGTENGVFNLEILQEGQNGIITTLLNTTETIARGASLSWTLSPTIGGGYLVSKSGLGPPPTTSVGGEWAPVTLQALTPVNTHQLLTPWISLISLMTLLATSFVYIRRKRRQS